MIRTVLTLLTWPVGVMNMLSGVAALIWLVILGEWWLIGLGFVFAVFGRLVVGLLSIAVNGAMIGVAKVSSIDEDGYIAKVLSNASTGIVVFIVAWIVSWLVIGQHKGIEAAPYILASFAIISTPFAAIWSSSEESVEHADAGFSIVLSELALIVSYLLYLLSSNALNKSLVVGLSIFVILCFVVAFVDHFELWTE